MDARCEDRETRLQPPAEERVKEPASAPLAEPTPTPEPRARKKKYERSDIGTIPRPFTLKQAERVIDKIGIATWMRMGASKRRAALRELKNE